MSQRIRIIARLRPRLRTEPDDGCVQVVRHSNAVASGSNAGTTSSINIVNPRDTSQVFKFQFSNCYDEASTQEEIFGNDVQPMVDLVYQGMTVTIFAYGVTSSGKTHTMQGSKAAPGVIPRTVEAIFAHRRRLVDATPTLAPEDISISMSYMEIYKDDVYDLLVTRENAPKLPVRENEHGKVFVANLTYEPIASFSDFETIYTRATKHRSVGSTNLNHASSRSHAILAIRATIFDRTHNRSLTGTINLVDLAGSENNKLTGNDASRMAESAAINKSLSVLGQVVHALNSNQTRIPYRNSKLTRILQDALGGSSVGLLICNLAPGAKFRQDTLNTLNFAVRTKNIENKPVVNEQDHRQVPRPPFPTLPSSIALGGAGPSGLPRTGAARQSLVPVPRKQARASVSVVATGAQGFQPMVMPPLKQEPPPGTMGLTLTEVEFEQKVAKVVEAEVNRRMEELERQRQAKEARARLSMERELALRATEAGNRASFSDHGDDCDDRERSGSVASEKENRRPRQAKSKSKSPRKESISLSIPAGILTPVLKRHKELDSEVRSKLQELEQKFDRSGKDAPDVLSPVSKKKMGRAYVAAARSCSEKGDLQAALDLYRKAESFVPDNIKLKERIIEIDWAVKNSRPFIPSPKPKKKSRSKAKSRRHESVEGASDQAMEMDHPEANTGEGRHHRRRKEQLKSEDEEMDVETELLHDERHSKRGRTADDERGGEVMEIEKTPAKRLRRSERRKNAVVVVDSEDDDDDMPHIPMKRGGQRPTAAT
ncbi:Kinesin-like protein [Pleurotus pulmonarius]